MADQAARERALDGLPVDDRRMDVAGIPTALLEGGEGPPVVLAHGPGESAFHWIRVIPSLVKTHRVVAPDLPGHGASGPLPEDGATRVVEWLEELIDRTCDEPTALVAATLGGSIAIRLAAARPDCLESLVLVDTLGLTAFEPEPRFGQALGAFLANPAPGTQADLWRVCAFDVDRVRAALGDRWDSVLSYNLSRIGRPGAMAGLGALMQEFALRAISEEELARIQVPTTLVWGRHDLATSVAVAEAASARYGWPLHVVEDCADAPAIEQPEAFLAALRIAAEDRMKVTR